MKKLLLTIGIFIAISSISASEDRIVLTQISKNSNFKLRFFNELMFLKNQANLNSQQESVLTMFFKDAAHTGFGLIGQPYANQERTLEVLFAGKKVKNLTIEIDGDDDNPRILAIVYEPEEE